MGATEMRLEVLVLPVGDVDRAKDFYERLGWRLDADVSTGDDFRLVQFTPPGSACSVHFGTGLTTAPPGSSEAVHLVVSDIDGAREQLASSGVEATDVFHCAEGFACRFKPHADERADGPAPDHATYSSFVAFADPDGNSWLLQEITERLPGRVDGPSYDSAADLKAALERAAAAHGEHEARTGEEDPDWPTWYAKYMTNEQSGDALPT